MNSSIPGLSNAFQRVRYDIAKAFFAIVFGCSLDNRFLACGFFAFRIKDTLFATLRTASTSWIFHKELFLVYRRLIASGWENLMKLNFPSRQQLAIFYIPLILFYSILHSRFIRNTNFLSVFFNSLKKILI
jgi:hypothetical protein